MKPHAIIAATLLAAGCASTPSRQPLQPSTVNQIARFAAQASAAELLAKKPQARADLVRAKQILATLAAGKQWNIGALAGAFQDAGFSVLNGQRGILIVQGAILAADLAGRQIDLQQSAYAEAAILGALDGLNLVLR